MSTLKVLKEYLVGEGGYLLNDDNNGKTVMLSGAWGSGKTYFWQNEIVRKQSKIIVNKRKRNKYSASELKEGLFALLKKKKKACVYISLYGKDNVDDIKSEVFTKAYSQIAKKGNKDKNIDTAIEWLGYGSKIASAVSFLGVKVDTTKITDGAKDYQNNEKLGEAQEAIRDGGVICFDDFERKSKNIDLNDLFGVLTQLSLEFNCKVIIILNSDVFEGEEANVFKTVKEKTVNKFFYFEPTVEELFDSIYGSDEKYKRLDDYKDEIMSAIKETEELNARIYIQVLDNCLEWIHKDYSNFELKNLTYITTFFVNYGFAMEYELDEHEIRKFELIKVFENTVIRNIFSSLLMESYRQIKDKDEVIPYFRRALCDNKDISEDEARYRNQIFYDNKKMFKDLWKYGYLLDSTLTDDYEMLNFFIKTGILLKKDEAVL